MSGRETIERDFGEWEYTSDFKPSYDVWTLGGRTSTPLRLFSPSRLSGDGGWTFDTEGEIDVLVTTDFLEDAIDIQEAWSRPAQAEVSP